MAAIIGCADRVFQVIRRGAVYEFVYTDNNSSTSQNEILISLRDTLLKVYAKCIEFLAHANTMLKEGTAEKMLHALLEHGKGNDILSSLNEADGALDSVTRACDVLKNNERHRTLLRELGEPLARVDKGLQIYFKRVEKEERKEILDYFSPKYHGDDHKHVSLQRTPGTGDWLLEKRSFREWQDSPVSALLWLRGGGE